MTGPIVIATGVLDWRAATLLMVDAASRSFSRVRFDFTSRTANTPSARKVSARLCNQQPVKRVAVMHRKGQQLWDVRGQPAQYGREGGAH